MNISVANTDVIDLLRVMKRGIVVTPNADHLMLLQKDEELYRIYCDAEYKILDSQVLYLFYKLIGKPFREKISGADLLPLYCDYHQSDTYTNIFMLGGIGDVAQRAKSILNSRYNRKMIVGAYSPSIGFEENKEENSRIIDMINSTNANILFIGVGTPKQEKWISHYKHLLKNIDLILCVGASLDFITGNQKRAPKILQKSGFEWAYRLLKDPRRLFYRYLIRDIKIFYYLLLEALNLYRDPFAERK
ncbi:MAG: WecB/TagA/CpsF family glycosyltransferase [Bacteroidota bacterium]